jgi:RNA polymerase-binding transcription factor
LAEPLNPNSSEQAVEMEDDVSLEGQAALIAREIVSVKRALTRIENGTYGECVRCGAEIAPKRLEVRRRQHCALNARAKNSNDLRLPFEKTGPRPVRRSSACSVTLEFGSNLKGHPRAGPLFTSLRRRK